MSFGFNVLKQEWDETDKNSLVRTLVDVNLHEISPTPFPAYSQTKVKVRSVQDDYDDYLADRSHEDIELNTRKIDALKMKVKIYESEVL
jgi:phage head maturation protease